MERVLQKFYIDSKHFTQMSLKSADVFSFILLWSLHFDLQVMHIFIYNILKCVYLFEREMVLFPNASKGQQEKVGSQNLKLILISYMTGQKASTWSISCLPASIREKGNQEQGVKRKRAGRSSNLY